MTGVGVWVVQSDGYGLRQVTNEVGASWDLAGDARLVHSEFGRGLFVVAPDGSSKQIYACALPVSCGRPMWAPDGSAIAFLESGTTSMRIKIITPDGTIIATSNDHVGEFFAWSPDNRRIAYHSYHPTTYKETLWLWTPASGALEAIAEQPLVQGRLDWSSNGRYLAWGEHDPSLLDLSTKKITTIDDAGTHTFHVALSRDGRVAIGGTGLVVTQLPDGTGRLLAQDADEPDWSPDDERIVFSRVARYGTGGYAEREIAVVDVDSGAVTTLVPTKPGFSMDRPRWSADGSVVAFDVGSYENSSSG